MRVKCSEMYTLKQKLPRHIRVREVFCSSLSQQNCVTCQHMSFWLQWWKTLFKGTVKRKTGEAFKEDPSSPFWHIMGDARRISCLTAVSSIMSSLTTAPRSGPHPPTLLSPNPYFSPYLLYSLLIPSLVNHCRDVALWCRQLRGSHLSSFPHLKPLYPSPNSSSNFMFIHLDHHMKEGGGQAKIFRWCPPFIFLCLPLGTPLRKYKTFCLQKMI